MFGTLGQVLGLASLTAADAWKVGTAAVTVVSGVVLAGRRRRRLRREERRAAYLRFEQASAEVTTRLAYLPALPKAIPSLLAEFVHTRILTDALDGMRAALAEFAVALREVRLVGNPEPRAEAEEITALLSELGERVPHTRWPRHQRQREEDEFAEAQLALGEAHKQFTLVCRRDLGYARPLRQRRWQLWRPQSDEQWPGGWPGPTVQGLLDAAGQRRTPRP